jgi:hypothetical protein
MKRRALLQLASKAGLGAAAGTFLVSGMEKGGAPARYRTPYKFGKLVLGPSGTGNEFDSRSVDCPFLFRHAGRFYMTYVGWDGIGYQTGLASSTDLLNWKRLGCILKRDPASEVTRYNVAMNWIVRENGLWKPGELLRIEGRFLGAYHAYPNSGYEAGPAVIGLCWSDDLMHWSLDPPCLRPADGALGSEGAFTSLVWLKRATDFICSTTRKPPRREVGANKPALRVQKI